MTLNKLLSLLPKHPRKAYEDALENKPWICIVRCQSEDWCLCEMCEGLKSGNIIQTLKANFKVTEYSLTTINIYP